MIIISGYWKSGQVRLQRLWRRHCGQATPKAAPACNAVALPARRSCASGAAGGRAGCGGQVSPKASHCGGQATVEYAIVAGVMVALVAIMSLMLTTFGDYGERVLQMIASDYP